MVICKICNREFKSLLSLTFHLKSKEHGTTPKEYYDKYLRQDGEGICHSCGKETTFRNINLGYRIYCSSFCSNNCEERIQKIKQTNLERYGYDYGLQSPLIKEKCRKTRRERYGYSTPFGEFICVPKGSNKKI